MSTQALIRYLKNRNLTVKKGYSLITIYAPNGVLIANIRHNLMYHMHIEALAHLNIDRATLMGLFYALTDYAGTPLEEREEEERYMLDPLAYDIGTQILAYNPETKEWATKYLTDMDIKNYQTMFTRTELEELDIQDQYFNLIPVYPQEDKEGEE